MELSQEQVEALGSLVKLSVQRVTDMLPRVQQDGAVPIAEVRRQRLAVFALPFFKKGTKLIRGSIGSISARCCIWQRVTRAIACGS